MSDILKFGNLIRLPKYASDPSNGEDGAIYYNTSSNSVRQYVNGGWTDIPADLVLTGLTLNENNIIVGDGSNLSAAVDSSAAGDILADSTNGLTIKAGVITDAEVNASAAITLSKLAALSGHNKALESDASGFIVESAVTSTELGYVAGVTSAIQAQLDAKALASREIATSAPLAGGGDLSADRTLSLNIANTDSVDLSVSGSNLVADVNLDAAGPLTSSADGVNIAVGNGIEISNGDSSTLLLLHLDDSLADASASGITVTTNGPGGSSVYAAGKFSDGYDVATSNNSLYFPSTGAFNFGTNDVTIEMQVKFNALGSTYQLFGQTVAGVGDGWSVYLDSSNQLTYFSRNGGDYTLAGSSGISDTNFHHIALVRNGNNLDLYVDGVSVAHNGSFTAAIPFNGVIPTTSTVPFNFGSNYNDGLATPQFVDGVIDEVRVSNVARWTTTFTPPAAAYTVDFAVEAKVDNSTIDFDISGNLEVKAGGISNTQVNASAAITLTKLAALSGHNKALQSNGSGFISESSVTSTELGYVAGATSNIQDQIDALSSSSLSENHIFVGNASNVATDVAMSGEASIVASGAVTLDNDSVIAKVLTAYTAGAGTVSSADSILSAIEKVDGNDALKLPLAGGTMSGNIDMGNNGIGNASYLNSFQLSVTGGAIDMGAQPVSNVGDPVSAQDAMTLNYAGLTYVPLSSGNTAGGYPILDGGGKVAYAQLPSALMTFKGAWDASSNTPTLADGTGAAGDTYRVSVAGTQDLGSGSQTYFIGDFVIYNGSIWERSPAADGVISVNGATGAVTVNAINQLTGDVTAGPASGSASAVATIANLAVTNAKIANSTIDLTAKVTGVLPVANGGTNSSTTLNNNRVMKSSSGAIVEAAAITAARALISDANGIPTHSVVTPTELGYVSGVTSSIQTQLNSVAQASPGDLNESSFSGLANNTATQDITGFAFANATVRSFDAVVSILINASSNSYAQYKLNGIQKGSSWDLTQSYVGDDITGFMFNITTAGQVQASIGNISGFTSAVMKFRAITTSV